MNFLKRYRPTLYWIVFATVMSIWTLTFSDTYSSIIHLALVLMWVSILLKALPLVVNPLGIFLRLIHRVPFIFWLSIIFAYFALIVAWVIAFQPAIGIPLRAEEVFFLSTVGVSIYIIASTSLTLEDIRHMSNRLSWRVNLLIMLTTLLLSITGIELGMRFLLVMSDNFAFSKLHQNWVRLYWNPINTIGYRDLELPIDSSKTNIIVMGDSLASGYGVNSILDTFPHLLAETLGTDYTANIVAEPGWGTNTAFGALKAYPLKPDILIMSFYINDIVEGPAKDLYQTPFPGIRANPDPTTEWWVNNFFIANFYYYRIFHYTQVNSGQKYLDWILNAYNDESVWERYTHEIDEVTTWSTNQNTQLIALIWGNLANLDSSLNATEKVKQYFIDEGITVVYMPEILRGHTPAQLMVNVFDAHPNIFSHQEAATALAQIIAK